MKELLLSKGFELIECKDGVYWVWETKDIHFMDEGYKIFQCTEDFKDFVTSFGGWVEKHTETEFVQIVTGLIS